MRKQWVFDYLNFGSRKIHYSNATVITSYRSLEPQTVGLKILSLPSFALKSPKIIFMSYLGNWSDTYPYNYSQKLTSESSLLFSSKACVFRTIWHQQPLTTMPDTLPPTKTNISNCSYNFPTHKTIIFQIYDINSLVQKKSIIPCWSNVTRPIQLHVLPPNRINTWQIYCAFVPWH
jgi:hypothetical protein